MKTVRSIFLTIITGLFLYGCQTRTPQEWDTKAEGLTKVSTRMRIKGDNADRVEKGTPWGLGLRDGSFLIGTPSVSIIPLRTAAGEIQVPLGQVRSVWFRKDLRGAIVEMMNEDYISGELMINSMELSTVFGKASVAAANLRILTRDTGLQTLLPNAYRYFDLLPLNRDPSAWQDVEDVRYRLRSSFHTGVNIDGACDCDLAASKTGLIALSELDTTHTVSVYDIAGTFLKRSVMPHHPSGVAWSPAGGILVSSNFGPLQWLQTDGVIKAIGPETTDDVCTGLNGKTYAIDSRECTIVRLEEEEAKPVARLEGYRSGMKKIFVDRQGNMFLADWGMRKVYVYSEDGGLACVVDARGTPWSVVASGSILCYSTSSELVFYDFLKGREIHRIHTPHSNAALALGPAGELITCDATTDRIYVYENTALSCADIPW